MPAFQTHFFWIFLVFYCLYETVHVGLDVLNYRFTKKQKSPPDFYKDLIDEKTFSKSQAYTLQKQRFGLWQHIIGIPFFWALIFLYGFQTFDVYAAKLTSLNSLSHSVLFCLLVGLYFTIINLPFKIYKTFVIETKYGFNKTTPKLFIIDLIKGAVLSLMIMTPILYLVFWLIQKTGNLWWLFAWAFLMIFQILITGLYPTVIAPLFNKFTPLADDDLKNQIETLAQKIRFRMSGIFTIDGSKRSGHSNAYFAGFGKMRRIVLFDTLINQLTQKELLAVLAHEMGHNVKNHILKSMILSALMSLAGLFVLSLLMAWPDFYKAFHLNPSAHAALVIFSVCSGVFLFPITPLMNMFSRKNEYEADAFSAEITQNPEAMKNSLIKLTKENLSQLNPHRFYSFFHYSHPSTKERIQALENVHL